MRISYRLPFSLNDALPNSQYDDNRLPVVPKHQYRAELRLGTDTFSVTPNIEWTPKGAWTDYSNTTRAPGYTLLGLSAEAVVRDGVTLFLDARNLTGKKAVGDISAVIMSRSEENTTELQPLM